MSKLEVSDTVYGFTYDDLSDTLFILTEKGIKVIDASDYKNLYYYAMSERPKGILLSPDGKKLGVGFGKGIEILTILEDKSLERNTFIWYPKSSYSDVANISFQSNDLIFSEGYIIQTKTLSFTDYSYLWAY